MNDPRADAALTVCLVARNEATLDDLRDYLAGVGIACRVARSRCAHAAGAPAAVVVFPDDHPEPDRAAIVDRLRRGHRVAVVVTREPQRYRAPAEGAPGRGDAVILPRPSFGWTILDALRARLAGSSW